MTKHEYHPAFRTALAAILCILLLAGCQSKGVVFPPVEPPVVWPAAPEPPRIRYVGQLQTDTDLKPAVSFFKGLGRALFGKKPIQSMLTPFAVTTDGKDKLFVADSNAQLVHVFDLNSRAYARWKPEKGFSQPVGVAYDPAGGNLYVSDSVAACVYVFDRQGKNTRILGANSLKRPCGLAWDASSSRLIVADSAHHQVIVLDPAGQELHRIGRRGIAPGEFNFPIHVVMDHQGRLYVCDSLNFRVQQFDASFNMTRVIGKKGDMPGYFSTPKGLAVDSENHLYVVDANFESVQIFDADGQLLLDFGTEGHKPGEFWLPAGIFIDPSNRIWVADSYNRRVQVFDYLPEVKP